MDPAEQPEPTQAVEGDLSTRFTSSLALPSHDEADSPALLLSQDEHRQACLLLLLVYTLCTSVALEPLLSRGNCYGLCRPDAAATQDDRVAEQNQRRQELREYLELMRTRQGSDDTSETQTRFGLDFYNLVQRLSQEQKAEYASIRGMQCAARSPHLVYKLTNLAETYSASPRLWYLMDGLAECTSADFSAAALANRHGLI